MERGRHGTTHNFLCFATLALSRKVLDQIKIESVIVSELSIPSDRHWEVRCRETDGTLSCNVRETLNFEFRGLGLHVSIMVGSAVIADEQVTITHRCHRFYTWDLSIILRRDLRLRVRQTPITYPKDLSFPRQ